MATYRKLQDGSWGVTGPTREIVPGSTITVTTKAGERKTETVDQIVSTEGEKVTATILKKPRGASAAGTYRGTGAKGRSYSKHRERKWCYCDRPVDEGDGECMMCGYQIR